MVLMAKQFKWENKIIQIHNFLHVGMIILDELLKPFTYEQWYQHNVE